MSRNSLIAAAATSRVAGHPDNCACRECEWLLDRALRASHSLDLLDAGAPKVAVQSRKPVTIDGKRMSERTTVRSGERQRKKLLARWGGRVVGLCTCGEELRLLTARGALFDAAGTEHIPAGLAHGSVKLDPVFKRAVQLAPEGTLAFKVNPS